MKQKFERRYLMAAAPLYTTYEEIARDRSTKHCIQQFKIVQHYNDEGDRYRATWEGRCVTYEKCVKNTVYPGYNTEATECMDELHWQLSTMYLHRMVQKKRIQWTDRQSGYLYCIDFIESAGLIIMEVETPVPLQKMALPQRLHKQVIKDVTADPAFSNYELSKFI